MVNYKELYIQLFGAIEDALEYLEAQQYAAAHERLITAQREAEEIVISQNDNKIT